MRDTHSKAGFTLVEVMVAMAILMVVTLAFGRGLLMAVQTNSFANNYYTATCIARNRVQRARAQDFDSMNLLAETLTPIDSLGNQDTAGNFRRTTLVTYLSATCIDLTVHIYYPEGRQSLSDVPLELRTKISYETQKELFQ